ncbi:Dip2/Utp12 family-domain-containing protein [Lasiosphaeria miniovina]|uniref:Dip2/Utp12 family-domain-containing protein n=1 Tax=Lasiosphaeria miniovina TaxID=1954250 RepID=A0AA39ZYG3_9PEZI|nr:Dip2/Utp12 family-domain-containing protein [Lasiosphaeria miniovina]KAK0705915.1 Dip2/Utp12 family-domain-containing protein [Lasiosphaeria miniovina]
MSSRRKPPTILARPVVKPSAKTPVMTRIDETRTAVSTGLSPKSLSQPKADAIEISSDWSSHASGSDNEEGETDAAPTADRTRLPKEARQKAAAKLKPEDGDAEMTSPKAAGEGGDNDGEEDDDAAEPTFGDLVRGGSSTIDVPAALAAQQLQNSLSKAEGRQKQLTRTTAGGPLLNSTSLGTVLNQALRTDDADLLESCLQTNDAKIIQNTINRMDSALAGVLLSKLAGRMHRRPGRAFGLMKWMQWTLVAHGGTLVTQPDLVNRLGELSRVLEERSRGLSSLLALKGKLDMLDAQMRFRKSVKTIGSRGGDDESAESDDESDDDDADEPGVVYVEGQDEAGGGKTLAKGTAAADDDFPVIGNGVAGDSDDESEEDDDEDVEELESIDEDEIDHDDVESAEEDESDGDGPPAKVQKVSSKFAKRK